MSFSAQPTLKSLNFPSMLPSLLGAVFGRLLFVTSLLLLVLTGSSNGLANEASDGAKSSPPIAFAARITGNEKRFRLLVDFDKSVDPNLILLGEPARFIVDLPEVVFSLGDSLSTVPSALVKSVQFGTVSAGKSRVVVTLSGPVAIERQSVKQLGSEQRFRLIADLVVSSQEKFKAAAEQGAKLVSNSAATWKGDRVRQGAEKKKKFVIVIDPGHGGIDGGAVGRAKTIEKNITLKFANVLLKKLEDDGRFVVKLTRKADVFKTLSERVAVARKNQADLMISIHADTLRQSRIRGATVYTLSQEGTDEQSRELAQDQNRADLIAGMKLPKVDNEVTDILIDLTRRETKVFSDAYAKLLVERMMNRIRLIKNPHRSADFFVLRAPEIPSVLLELGYLSNPQDEKQMKSDAWHSKMADAVQQSILAFFATRLAQE